MSDIRNQEVEATGTRQRVQQYAAQNISLSAQDDKYTPYYPQALLGDASLKGLGNAAVRISTMQRAQATHGNRAVQRYVGRTVSVQRDDDEERKLRFSPLPPRLEMPLGPLDAGLSLGGPDLSYNRGPFRASAEYGWGGPLELGAGYGAPLLPWMMDVEPSLAAGAGGINSLMRNPSSPAPGSLGAIGGMAGTLGDIAGAGESNRYNWGVGLQGMIGPEEQRIMAGLRLDF